MWHIQVGIAHQTAVDWYAFIRDVCSQELLHQPFQLGGPGHTVAIDKTLVARQKPGNNHSQAVPPQWCFGAVDLMTKQIFIQIVPDRSQATLQLIIQAHILPGTRVWSDEWRAYFRLDQQLPHMNYIHGTVNHQQLFADPVTGCQTNNNESRWNACKMCLKRHCGVERNRLPEFLDEYMWWAL